MRTTVATLALLALLAVPGTAQLNCSGDRICDATENVLAGAALNLALRGPWTAWRGPTARVALGTGVTMAFFAVRSYETGEPYDWFNLTFTITGLVATEVGWWLVHQLE